MSNSLIIVEYRLWWRVMMWFGSVFALYLVWDDMSSLTWDGSLSDFITIIIGCSVPFLFYGAYKTRDKLYLFDDRISKSMSNQSESVVYGDVGYIRKTHQVLILPMESIELFRNGKFYAAIESHQKGFAEAKMRLEGLCASLGDRSHSNLRGRSS